MHNTRTGNHETPTIIPRQSRSIQPAHARRQLWSVHTRAEPKGLTDRERLGNVFQRPRGVYEPRCRKVTTKSAQDALNCVLPSPRNREGCAITPSVSRTIAETAIHDTTPRSSSGQEVHAVHTAYDLARCARSKQCAQRTGNPGITASEDIVKPCGRPGRTFDCWCLILRMTSIPEH